MKKTIFYVAVLVLTAAFIVLLCVKKSTHNARELSAEQIPAYLLENGWETAPERISSVTVTIPYEFNETYIKYNMIQTEQGFDLSRYKGEKAVLVTCPVTNYSGDEGVYAELIIRDTELIGAALVSDSCDGFIKPLNKH